MKPMVGTIVFYGEPRFDEPQAAMITRNCPSGGCNLMVFPHNGGAYSAQNIHQHPGGIAQPAYWWAYRISPGAGDQVGA